MPQRIKLCRVIQAGVEETPTCCSATDVIVASSRYTWVEFLSIVNGKRGWFAPSPRASQQHHDMTARYLVPEKEGAAHTACSRGQWGMTASSQMLLSLLCICTESCAAACNFLWVPQEFFLLFSYSHTSWMHGRVFKLQSNLYLHLLNVQLYCSPLFYRPPPSPKVTSVADLRYDA